MSDVETKDIAQNQSSRLEDSDPAIQNIIWEWNSEGARFHTYYKLKHTLKSETARWMIKDETHMAPLKYGNFDEKSVKKLKAESVGTDTIRPTKAAPNVSSMCIWDISQP